MNEKRTCVECGVSFGRRVYASLQIECPSDFKKRLTCGNPVCVQAHRRAKLARGKTVEARQVTPLDLFIYGEKAMANYINLRLGK